MSDFFDRFYGDTDDRDLRYPAPQPEAPALSAEKAALKAKIDAGQHSNADLRRAVELRMARNVYADPQSARPTGIEWVGEWQD